MTALVKGQQLKKPDGCRAWAGPGSWRSPILSPGTCAARCTVAPRPLEQRIGQLQASTSAELRALEPLLRRQPTLPPPRSRIRSWSKTVAAAARWQPPVRPFPSKGASCTKGWAFSGRRLGRAIQAGQSPVSERRTAFEAAGPRGYRLRRSWWSATARSFARLRQAWQADLEAFDHLSELCSPSCSASSPKVRAWW